MISLFFICYLHDSSICKNIQINKCLYIQFINKNYYIVVIKFNISNFHVIELKININYSSIVSLNELIKEKLLK